MDSGELKVEEHAVTDDQYFTGARQHGMISSRFASRSLPIGSRDVGTFKIEQRNNGKVHVKTAVLQPRFEYVRTDGDTNVYVNPVVNEDSQKLVSQIGSLLTWFGCFGLNAGSQMALTGAVWSSVVQCVV